MVDVNKRIAVIGLGYVGLAISCGVFKKYNVIGFDINTNCINELQEGIDVTHEIKASELSNTKN